MAEGDGLGFGADAFGGFGIDAETDDVTEAQQQAIVDALTGKGTQEAQNTAKDYGEQVGKNTIAVPGAMPLSQVTVTGVTSTGTNSGAGGLSGGGAASGGRGTGAGSSGFGGTSSTASGGTGSGSAISGGGSGTGGSGTGTGLSGGTGGDGSSTGTASSLFSALSNAVSAGGATGGAMAASAVKAYMAQALQKAIQNDPQSLPPNSLERVLSQIWQASRGAGMSGETTFGHMMDFTTGFVQGVIGQLPGGHALTIHMETPATIAAETFNTIGKAIGPDIAKLWGLQEPKDWKPGGVFGGSPDITDPTPWGRAEQSIKDQQAQSVLSEITAAIEYGRNPISMNPMVSQSINPDTRDPEQVIRDLLREIDPQLQGVGPDFETGFQSLFDPTNPNAPDFDPTNPNAPDFDPVSLTEHGRGHTPGIMGPNIDFNPDDVVVDPDPNEIDLETFFDVPDFDLPEILMDPRTFDPELFGPNVNPGPFTLASLDMTERGPTDFDPVSRDFNPSELEIEDLYKGIVFDEPNPLDLFDDPFANISPRSPVDRNISVVDLPAPAVNLTSIYSAIGGPEQFSMDIGRNPTTFQNNPEVQQDLLTSVFNTPPVDPITGQPTGLFGHETFVDRGPTEVTTTNPITTTNPVTTTNPGTTSPGVTTGDPSGGRGISTGISGGTSGGISSGISGDPGGLLGSIAMSNPSVTDPGAGNIPPDLLQQMIMQGLIRV